MFISLWVDFICLHLRITICLYAVKAFSFLFSYSYDNMTVNAVVTKILRIEIFSLPYSYISSYCSLFNFSLHFLLRWLCSHKSKDSLYYYYYIFTISLLSLFYFYFYYYYYNIYYFTSASGSSICIPALFHLKLHIEVYYRSI